MKTESKEEIINSIKQYMYDESIETSETKTKIIAQPYFISVIKKVYENNFGEENTSGKNLSEKKTKTEIKNYDHNIDMYRENERNNKENYNHNVEDYSKTEKKNIENAADKITTINDSSENETTKEKVKNEYVLIAGDFDKLNELNEEYGFEEGSKSMKKVLEKIIKVLEKDLDEKQKLLACRIGRRRVCILNRWNRAQPTK